MISLITISLLRTPAVKIYRNANVDLSPIQVILGPHEPHTKVSSLAQYRDFTLHIGGLAGLWNFEHFLTWKMGCFGDFSNISRSPRLFLMFFFLNCREKNGEHFAYFRIKKAQKLIKIRNIAWNRKMVNFGDVLCVYNTIFFRDFYVRHGPICAVAVVKFLSSACN